MAENSKIEWCHHTVNFWWGCAKVSPGCEHCYAEGQAGRFYPGIWGPEAARHVRIEAACWEAMRYDRQAVKQGRRFRVFTNSMSDFFEDRVALTLARLEALDVMRLTPHLDWLILTKRPGNILSALRDVLVPSYRQERYDLNGWLEEWLAGNPPANIWLGTTVEDQERADQRIPELLQVPAAVRFLSCEPLLGAVDLRHLVLKPTDHPELGKPDVSVDAMNGWYGGADEGRSCIDWVICGGESGPKARPMHPDWARGLRDQCAEAGVPFLLKQLGEWGPSAEDLATGEPRYRVFRDADHWWNKGQSWMSLGDILLDAEGMHCHSSGHIQKGVPPFTALRQVGKKAAGRLLDGRLHDEYPRSGE